MLQTKRIETIKTHILFFSIFFRKSCNLWCNVEKYSRAREASDNITRIMCSACWITKARETHSECVILIAFPQQQTLTRTRLSVKFWFIISALLNIIGADSNLFREYSAVLNLITSAYRYQILQSYSAFPCSKMWKWCCIKLFPIIHLVTLYNLLIEKKRV
jgi:hypothetical protein